MLLEGGVDRDRVPEIQPHEFELASKSLQSGEILWSALSAEIIDNDYFMTRHKIAARCIRADKSGSSSDQYLHIFRCLPYSVKEM